MLDESSQIRNNSKLNKRVRQIIQEYGIPHFFASRRPFFLNQTLYGGRLSFPSIAMPIFKSKLRSETDKIIIPKNVPD